MTDRRTVIALLIAGGVLLMAAGVLLVVYTPVDLFTPSPTPRPTLPPIPTLEVTPPASLAELAEQYPELAPILTDPELDSIYKEFLVAYEEGGEEAALELANDRGLLTPEGDIRVTLILDTTDHTALVAQLEQAQITVVSAYRDRVNVAVPMEMVSQELESEEPGAVFAQLTELEHVIAVRLPETRIPEANGVEGEGVAVINANAWHAAGFTGEGLRIGVLDLGFGGYEALLGSELPDQVPMETFGWYNPEEIHGTACAEIVHEVAPDAELFFAWYDGSDAAMGEAIDWLLDQDVHIISHSAGGLIGPRDGSEWDARLVDDLAGQGILWVNAAGNEALSHYRGLFTDEDGDGFHEFQPGEEVLGLYNRGYIKVALSWEDNWGQATQDYELFLLSGDGDELAASQDAQSGDVGHEPVEWIEYQTGGDTVYAVISAYDVSEAVVLDIFVGGADVAYPSADYSICPPADALGSLTVGAVNWWDDSLADYSSRGPTADERLKPEISAPTGVSGITYGPENFDGTSASAPHVAGAAALVWQANPQFGRQELVDFLLNNVVDLGPGGPDTGYGYGRLQLPQPPEGTSAPPATPTSTSAPDSTPTPSDADAPTPTSQPLPTPTPFVYATPAPPSGAGAGLLALTGVGLLVGGLGCVGMMLLLVGGIGLLIMVRRRRRRTQPPPVSPPPPFSPPPPPVQPTPTTPEARGTRCANCGAVVRPGARFCAVCGSPMTPAGAAPRCRNCGAELREGARFCPKCGQPT